MLASPQPLFASRAGSHYPFARAFYLQPHAYGDSNPVVYSRDDADRLRYPTFDRYEYRHRHRRVDGDLHSHLPGLEHSGLHARPSD